MKKNPSTSDASASAKQLEAIDSMTMDRTVDWVSKQGFPTIAEVLRQHEIDGPSLVGLTEDHLKEMGVIIVGTRIKFMKSLTAVKEADRARQRMAVVWEADEVQAVTCTGQCYYSLQKSFCGVHPARFKLTGTTLRIQTTVFHCLSCRVNVENDTIKLVNVTDVDTKIDKALCCRCCNGVPDVIIVSFFYYLF
jgi:hypothetical protein